MSSRKQQMKQYVDEMLVCQQPCARHRRVYWNLIREVRAKSEILSVGFDPAIRKPEHLRVCIRALGYMAKYRTKWIRQPEFWRPEKFLVEPTSNRVALRSLMKHLFERYPVPNFMAFAWMRPHAKRWYHELYLHMAAGRGVRQFKQKPGIALSPTAAKCFLKTPDHLEPGEAMRWAQIRGFSGSKELAAELVRNTILKEPTRDERFWETMIRFLIREKPSYIQHASMLVDFVDEQRFQPAEKVWGRGGGPLPLQPKFSMKGRTLGSLWRHMSNWRQELLLKRPSLAQRNFHWPAIEVQPMVHQDGDVKWIIFELLNDRALMLEGAAMDHCVSDYVEQCADRKSSIWSMRIHLKGCPKRIVTIEVDPERKAIVQAQAKSNEDLSPAANEILRRWATREGLVMSLED
ncbi:PcfJ domain-containing protein [Bremerella alba]|uniref:PcfJ-like protein n=1 Tax=Bremerella alba TaxID=980252 RepID=A0A7V9A6G7_9BACT|nr:PcfJ domain-containing protein [Bremerella alba]MBA2114365.1 hypothetical protein [Bremerella alba]